MTLLNYHQGESISTNNR